MFVKKFYKHYIYKSTNYINNLQHFLKNFYKYKVYINKRIKITYQGYI